MLTETEIVRFWHACDKVGEPIAQVLKLLLLTGCRRTELAGMRRDELGDDGTFVIPSSRTKNKRPHVVPLPALARAIIASVKPVASPVGYVFTNSGKSPVGGWSMIKNRLDAAMGNPPAWRLHDLRRTFVTGLADLGIRPDVLVIGRRDRGAAASPPVSRTRHFCTVRIDTTLVGFPATRPSTCAAQRSNAARRSSNSSLLL